jgi:hypothetical protein
LAFPELFFELDIMNGGMVSKIIIRNPIITWSEGVVGNFSLFYSQPQVRLGIQEMPKLIKDGIRFPFSLFSYAPPNIPSPLFELLMETNHLHGISLPFSGFTIRNSW